MCICRGHQLLNIARGGDLYQDIKITKRKMQKHGEMRPGIDSNHKIYINRQSRLFRILRRDFILANSNHHQIINKLGRGLKVAATSADGVIEALDMPGYPFLLSLQWHPERIFNRAHSRKLFTAIVEAAGAQKRSTDES